MAEYHVETKNIDLGRKVQKAEATPEESNEVITFFFVATSLSNC